MCNFSLTFLINIILWIGTYSVEKIRYQFSKFWIWIRWKSSKTMGMQLKFTMPLRKTVTFWSCTASHGVKVGRNLLETTQCFYIMVFSGVRPIGYLVERIHHYVSIISGVWCFIIIYTFISTKLNFDQHWVI